MFLLVGVLVAGSFLGGEIPTARAAAAAPTWSYTLYGDTIAGWGLTPSSLSKPGPVLAVTTGEILSLKLFSQDSIRHNWTIDLNNDSSLQPSEPRSADFSSPTVPTWFNYTVALGAGTYTYRCMIHPTSMWGELVVQAAPTFTLWGSAASGTNGWGSSSTSTTNPGPTLNVNQGQTVTIDLFSADGADHTFYVDFARSGSPTGNQVSGDFSAARSVRFTFTANTAGNFTYACGIHGASMKGTLHVAASSTTPPPVGPDYTVYAAVVVVVVVAAILVAVLIRRKPKTPPSQPPQP